MNLSKSNCIGAHKTGILSVTFFVTLILPLNTQGMQSRGKLSCEHN